MKNIFEILIIGFRNKRLVSTVYLIQFVLALTIGLQVYQVFTASIGHSVSLESLNLGNAHMVINDLLNVHGASLSPLLGQVRWMIIIYLIIACFIHAGLWYTLIHESTKLSFWIGGATYFRRTLAIGIVIIFFFVIMSAIIWLPFFSKFQYWMENLPSEAPILWGGIGLFIIWSLLSVYLFVASSFSKIFLIRDEYSILKSLLHGFKFSFTKTLKLLPVLFLFLLVLAIIYISHGFVDDWKIATSSVGILLLFIFQQLIIWVKIALRLSTYNYILKHI